MAFFAVNILDDSSDEDRERFEFELQNIRENNLIQQTRLNREVFNYVLELVNPALEKNTRRGRFSHVSPAHKLYLALQFYASGGFQWLVGSSGNVCQSTVSKAVSEVTTALVDLAAQFIKFPTAEEYPRVKQEFYALGANQYPVGMPNCLGAIDCTHIRLQAPIDHPEQYLNRHIYHSINAQFVVGPDLKIYNVNAEFPGSNHDAYIWRNSALRQMLEDGDFPSNGWFVGDSGYPNEPWLVTPITNPRTPAEQLYTSVQILTRNPVERMNGVLKSRWRCLSARLAYPPAKVCQITIACAVLHNICTEYRLPVDEILEIPPEQNYIFVGQANENVRDNLVNTHFTI